MDLQTTADFICTSLYGVMATVMLALPAPSWNQLVDEPLTSTTNLLDQELNESTSDPTMLNMTVNCDQQTKYAEVGWEPAVIRGRQQLVNTALLIHFLNRSLFFDYCQIAVFEFEEPFPHDAISTASATMSVCFDSFLNRL